MNTLGTQSVSEGVVTVEVLFQRSSKDRTIAVGGESTRQHGNVAKATFKWLICGHRVKNMARSKMEINLPKMFDILYSKF